MKRIEEQLKEYEDSLKAYRDAKNSIDTYGNIYANDRLVRK